jgi:excinuclease ABC subunit C
MELRQQLESTTQDIIVPFIPEVFDEKLHIHIAVSGDKKKLLDLAMQNVRQYKLDRLKQEDKLNPEQRGERILTEMQKMMGLSTLPRWIDCFDNSNISGSDAVASCVVFKKMKPSKKDYKRFNIKTVKGLDDYASMKEVVSRRYNRLVDEEQPLPDLIIADGGKGQMEVIREVIQDELNLDIPIAGLAKDDRHRTNELLYGFPPMKVALKVESELFHVLTQIQDEVHRFAITFHREKRSKHALHSELDDIKGIGKKTKDALLQALKSVKRIREADLETLSGLVGKAKAKIIFEHFHQEEE